MPIGPNEKDSDCMVVTLRLKLLCNSGCAHATIVRPAYKILQVVGLSECQSCGAGGAAASTRDPAPAHLDTRTAIIAKRTLRTAGVRGIAAFVSSKTPSGGKR